MPRPHNVTACQRHRASQCRSHSAIFSCDNIPPIMRNPYEQRTDLEKCHSQWWKLTGLHNREEWSAAIVRAATAAELATNFAIRTEFKNQSELREHVVDTLLHNSNGLRGKIDRLLAPLVKGSKRATAISKLKSLAYEINDTRNAIVHRGEFSDEDEAKAAIQASRRFIEGLVRLYTPLFTLRDQKESPTSDD
jgi:ribosomal protein S6